MGTWKAYNVCEQPQKGREASLITVGSGQWWGGRERCRSSVGKLELSLMSGNDLFAFLTLPSVSSELPQFQLWESMPSLAEVSGKRHTGVCSVLCICKQVLLCISLCNFPPELDCFAVGREEGWILYLSKSVLWYKINILFLWKKKWSISLKISLALSFWRTPLLNQNKIPEALAKGCGRGPHCAFPWEQSVKNMPLLCPL